MTGQGGNFLSPYYMDQWKAWYEGSTFACLSHRKQWKRAAAHRLVLEPGKIVSIGLERQKKSMAFTSDDLPVMTMVPVSVDDSRYSSSKLSMSRVVDAQVPPSATYST